MVKTFVGFLTASTVKEGRGYLCNANAVATDADGAQQKCVWVFKEVGVVFCVRARSLFCWINRNKSFSNLIKSCEQVLRGGCEIAIGMIMNQGKSFLVIVRHCSADQAPAAPLKHLAGLDRLQDTGSGPQGMHASVQLK